jgi:hypothetical protein
MAGAVPDGMALVIAISLQGVHWRFSRYDAIIPVGTGYDAIGRE